MKRALALASLFAAGIAAALAFGAPRAGAYTLADMGVLGFFTYSSPLADHAPDGRTCLLWKASRPPTAAQYGDVIGSDCDPDFGALLDAFIANHPPPTTAAPTTTTAPPATTTAPAATTTTAPATTTTTAAVGTTTTAAPAATTTVTAAAPSSPPVADFTASSPNPLVVTFTDASTAGSSAITTRVWQHGDGTAAVGPSTTHPYAGPGSYYVTLTVVDANGLTSVVVHQLTIEADKSIVLGPRQTQAVAPNTAAKARARAQALAKAKAAAKAKALAAKKKTAKLAKLKAAKLKAPRVP